jgi:hypothetical protein
MADGRSKLGAVVSAPLSSDGKVDKGHSPVGVYATEKFRLQVHVIKTLKTSHQPHFLATLNANSDLLVYDLVPVGLDLIFRNILKSLFTEKLQEINDH